MLREVVGLVLTGLALGGMIWILVMLIPPRR